MSALLRFLIGIILGLVAVMAVTARWWLPVADSLVERWLDWIDRKTKERGF